MPASYLTSSIYHSILESLNQSRSKSAEKRDQLRVGFRVRVLLHPFTEGCLEKPIEAWVRDLSKTGLGVICDAKLKVGRQFIISLQGDDSDLDRYMLYTVIRCQQPPGAMVSTIGSKLLRELPAPEFIRLPQATIKPTPPAGKPVRALRETPTHRTPPGASKPNPVQAGALTIKAPAPPEPTREANQAEEARRISQAILEQ